MMDADLSMAAHYYLIAVDKHNSARANFNLGFMHEWGIGLKQDFPLAKRHYDLAAGVNSAEATLAVQIALIAMSQHEYFLKLQAALKDWWFLKDQENGKKSVWFPSAATYRESNPKTQRDVIVAHIFDHTTMYIVILMYGVVQLMKIRGRQLQERERARVEQQREARDRLAREQQQ